MSLGMTVCAHVSKDRLYFLNQMPYNHIMVKPRVHKGVSTAAIRRCMGTGNLVLKHFDGGRALETVGLPPPFMGFLSCAGQRSAFILVGTL